MNESTNAPIFGTASVKAEDEMPDVRYYTHIICGSKQYAGNCSESSLSMPCTTCQSQPPQKEFSWE